MEDLEITCRDFVELATDYVERALPGAELDLVEEHLVICGPCRDHLAQYEATVEAVRRADAGIEPPPQELLRVLLGAFREQTS